MLRSRTNLINIFIIKVKSCYKGLMLLMWSSWQCLFLHKQQLKAALVFFWERRHRHSATCINNAILSSVGHKLNHQCVVTSSGYSVYKYTMSSCLISNSMFLDYTYYWMAMQSVYMCNDQVTKSWSILNYPCLFNHRHVMSRYNCTIQSCPTFYMS